MRLKILVIVAVLLLGAGIAASHHTTSAPASSAPLQVQECVVTPAGERLCGDDARNWCSNYGDGQYGLQCPSDLIPR